MKKIFFTIILLLIFAPFIVNAKTKYLYDVLKDEAEEGTFAKEYEGEHHDSFVQEPTHKIYHWYVHNNNDAIAIQNKDNVIFANQCWKIIRTTDTGGVKMIYNGEAKNGKCETIHEIYEQRTEQYLSPSYYYSSSFRYDAFTKKYSIAGIVTNSGVVVGRYTCKRYNIDDDCDAIYYVDEQSSGSYYYVKKVNVKFDTPFFNSSSDSSLASVGYMYNKTYKNYNKSMASYNYENIYDSYGSLSRTVWFGKNAVWGSPVSDKYNLSDLNSVSAYSSYSGQVGKYSFFNSYQTYTDSKVYYIAAFTNNRAYSIPISDGNTLSDVNYTYTYGDNYRDNGDGTYTITSPTTFYRTNYYLYYKNIKGKYMCKNAVNNTCSDLWHVREARESDINYEKVTNYLYKYAKSFTWDGSKYILDDDTSFVSWDVTKAGNKNKLNNAHYTCFNKSGQCTTLAYVFHVYNELSMYYVELNDGKSIEDVVNEMLYNDDVNVKDSLIKTRIDMFYENKLSNYSEYLEDTIFCNDRTQINDDINGWNPNGGDVSTSVKFKEYNKTNDLSCTNETDKFSTLNNKAKLKYKIGLVSSPEMNILRNSNIRNVGDVYWLGSPYSFDSTTPYMSSISSLGDTSYSYALGWDSLRPAISLKSNIKYVSGDGSENNPYIVDLTKYYSINVELRNETKDLNIELEDFTQVEYNKIVKFKVQPIKGYKVKDVKIIDEKSNEVNFNNTEIENEYEFSMPASNVTIIPSYERVFNSIDTKDSKDTEGIIIEVEDTTTVVYEDVVKFVVTPNDGYEVEDIEILDKNGNRIDYSKTDNVNEYEFTMPDTDVTIKPIYRKIESINVPDTIKNTKITDKIFVVILFTIVTLGMVTIIYKMRKSRY